ncbi:MAG: hypothetical protein V3V67_16790 [Myxococcota bacterium]
MSDSALEQLRERLPEALRSRLSAAGPADAWLEALGDELASTWLRANELEKVVALLVEAGSGSALVLCRMEELAPGKPGRKLVRRAIHRLKSRGVDVQPAERGPARSVLRPLDEEHDQGIATAPDSLGRRSLFLIVPVPGAARMYEIGLSDVDGLAHLEVFQGKRRDARSFSRRLREGEGARTVSVSAPALRALVRRAADVAVRVDPKLVAEVVRHAGEKTPGEELRSELAAEAREQSDRTADEVLRKCLETRELPPWPPVGEPTEALLAQLEAIEHSPLVLSDLQKRERRWELIREASERVFGRAYRNHVAARLEESAVFLLEGGSRAAAAAAIQVAARVRDVEDPLQVPFLELMLTLFLDAARERPDRRDPTRLIVPGGARALDPGGR